MQGPESRAAKRPTRGLSLPISLFVIKDRKSQWRPGHHPRGQKVRFKYELSRKEKDMRRNEPQFQTPNGNLPAHIYGFRFGFTADWGQAFNVGFDVAKKLWNTQNGRLRFADQYAAELVQQASLNVDLRAACDIVESVLSRV